MVIGWRNIDLQERIRGFEPEEEEVISEVTVLRELDVLMDPVFASNTHIAFSDEIDVFASTVHWDYFLFIMEFSGEEIDYHLMLESSL